MTKLNQFKEHELDQKLRYINEGWQAWREGRLQTLTRITNYLFVLNTGALLTALTYVATKEASQGILISIWLFAFGVFCSAAHATLDYYLTEISFSAYRKDVSSLYDYKLDWEVFVDRNEHRPPFDWLLHVIGWLSAATFFGGLVYGLQQIPST